MDNAVSNRIEFMGYDHNTANSPQKQGITGSGDGVALSYDSGLYGVQFGIARADSCPFIRIREDGSWKPWSNVALKSDLEFKLEYAAISYTTDIVGGTVYERNLDYTNAAFVIVATGLYDNVQDSVTVPAYYFKNSGAGTRTIVYYQSSTVEAYALGNNKIGIKVGNPVEHQSVKVWALKL